MSDDIKKSIDCSFNVISDHQLIKHHTLKNVFLNGI